MADNLTERVTIRLTQVEFENLLSAVPQGMKRSEFFRERLVMTEKDRIDGVRRRSLEVLAETIRIGIDQVEGDVERLCDQIRAIAQADV